MMLEPFNDPDAGPALDMNVSAYGYLYSGVVLLTPVSWGWRAEELPRARYPHDECPGAEQDEAAAVVLGDINDWLRLQGHSLHFEEEA